MEYHTTDIVLAAFLRTQGHNVQRIEKSGSVGTFIFKDVPAQTLTDFDLGQGLVEPFAFNNTIRQLTSAVRRL